MKAFVWTTWASLGLAASPPTATTGRNVTYNGIYRDQTDIFLGIRYGQDTSGEHRFKPPRPHLPISGPVIQATEPGPACPQPKGAELLPLYLGNITEISEDCLRLNVARPNGTTASSKLPVMVYIHGGSFIAASKDDPVSQPGGLILESVANGQPVIHVSINYRLGIFGFAQSDALKVEGSENAGLRDQRLALEWVQQNIAGFGGDPDNITIHGQSSGGLAVGMQIMAYGGSKPAPFHKAISQSQLLEAGITGNFTRDAMHRVIANITECSKADQQSTAAVECLRGLQMEELLRAQTNVHLEDPGHNVGDEWLPVVDGDFLPSPPSELIDAGRLNNISVIIGWCEDDIDVLLSPAPSNAAEVYDTVQAFLPVTDFNPPRFANGTIQQTAQFKRAARVFRDIIMTCMPFFYGQALAKAGNDVYYYNQNQTILTPMLEEDGFYGLGVVHTAEFAYMFGNFSHYDVYDYEIEPTMADYGLKKRQSRSWTSFAALGRPSMEGKETLEGWERADFEDENFGVYVIGGPSEGYAGPDGKEAAREVMRRQRLRDRCGFLNSAEVIKQVGY